MDATGYKISKNEYMTHSASIPFRIKVDWLYGGQAIAVAFSWSNFITSND